MTSVRHTPVVAGSPDDPLLDAARAAILAVGWRRTTLTEVARRAGVSRMTLYRRWPDMRALLGDLLTREWGALMVDRFADDVTTLPDAVVALVRAVREDPLFRKIVEVDPELLLPYLLERRGRTQDLLLDHLVPLLRDGQRSGTVRDGDPQAIARGLVLACHGFVVSAATMTDRSVRATALDAELHHLVESGLRP